jgi:RNA polymerase sigma-70 factor (ECF subfamily)
MYLAITPPAWIAGRPCDDGPWRPADPPANPVNTPLTPTDDAHLLRRVGQRDREAFSLLYDRYSGILYSTILRVLNNPDEAADVLQETFVQIWEKASAYDPELGKPFSWAITLARHKAIDRLRALQRRYNFIEEITNEAEDDPPALAAGADEVFTQEQAAHIRGAVATLPLEQRQAIELAFLGGLTHDEIATELKQPLGTVKARIRRGLLKLRDSLKHLV